MVIDWRRHIGDERIRGLLRAFPRVRTMSLKLGPSVNLSPIGALASQLESLSLEDVWDVDQL